MKHLATSLLTALLAVSASLPAQSFPVSLKDGGTLYFSVTDTVRHTVEVSPVPKLAFDKVSLPNGSLSIPSTIRYRDTVWHVTAIADKAFEGSSIEFVSIPSTVGKIGDSAFANCESLKGLVFPGRQVKVSDDAFAGCKALENITFGSDWTELDLAPFGDSEALRTVRIPARVSRLVNLKTLAALESVEVDPNNQHFSSVDGLLYSKNGKTLYACPRAREGSIEVLDGTESILEGALWDCPSLESVILPATVNKVSYLEFSRCTNLKSLIMLSPEPVMTARFEGREVFCFRVPSIAFNLFVPSAAVSAYQAALCTSSGNYENMDGSQKSYCQDSGFLGKKAVKKIRK